MRLFLLLLSVLATTLIGCATRSVYTPPPSSANVATIAPLISNGDAMTIRLEEIDGQQVDFHRFMNRPVPVAAGERKLKVNSAQSGFMVAGAEATLVAELEAGHAYQVRCTQSRGQITFWLEDLTAHSQASDRVTVKRQLAFPETDSSRY